jgi:L-ribulose-5-phosphate 3-epimerase
LQHIVAVNSNCYHGYSIEDAIEGIQKAGFHYIELTATKGWTEHVFPTMSFSKLWDVKERLKAAGLVPIAMSGHCNLMDTERLSDFIENIRLTGFFGCEYIVSSIGEAHLKDNAVVSNNEVTENIRSFLPYLEENNLKLVLEVHGAHGSGKILKTITDQVGSKLVTVNYDTANAIFYGDVDLAEDLNSCMDSIGYMHIKDKSGGRQEWNFPALGKGYVDFPMVFEKLDKACNPCPLSIEIEFTKDGSADVEEVNQAVRDSASYLKELGFQL